MAGISSEEAGAAARDALRTLQATVIAYQKPAPDGRRIVVERQLFSSARICIGSPEADSYDDQWDYDSVTEAVAEAVLWNPEKDDEPAFWVRHAKSGRRRPGSTQFAQICQFVNSRK